MCDGGPEQEMRNGESARVVDALIYRVEKYIDSHKLLKDDKLYIVALSGGADSVALLLLLKRMGYKVHAAHCNFHLRGAESDRDEQFCESLCQMQDIPFHKVHFATRDYSDLHKISIEMAARKLRYGWFEQLRRDLGAAGVCVAHHRDDSVETVLMNMLRGTGVRGLTGIQPRNGHVLRPLLDVSRNDIETYLSEIEQPFVTDSSNLETDVLRNRIRLELLPLLCQLNPAVRESIYQMSENVSEAQRLLDAVLERFKSNNKLVLEDLDKYGSREYIVFEWARGYGFNGSQIRQAIVAETGRMFHSEKGFTMLADRGTLLVEPTMKPLKAMIIPETGTYRMTDTEALCVEVFAMKSTFTPSKERDIVTLDAECVHFPLTMRPVAIGDRMHPFGMSGCQLISDMMTNLHMNAFEKQRQLVVEDARGEIVWLVGLRTSEKCRVDMTSTRQILLLRHLS